MTRSAVSSLTSPRVSALSARETVPGCTRAARATSRRVTGPPDAIGGDYADVCSTGGRRCARKHLLPVKDVPPAPRSFDRRAMAFLSLGHLCVDLCQGALPALLPFLIAAHHWSYGQASALVLAATVSSSIVQPLFGHLSDGRSLPWLLPGGVALAAAGISLAGVVGSYWLTFAVVVASRLCLDGFTPVGAGFSNFHVGAE